MSYKLDKPFTDIERIDFIVKYNHNNGLKIEETDTALYALEINEIMVNGEPIIDPEYEKKQQDIENERIQSLSMTKSDFFDGMIRAFGLDQDDLQPVIEAILTQLPISDIDKKVAMNNYKNAKDFYRKHTLFTLLSDREIPISEDLSIKISSMQWDKFFDETNKGDKEAYKKLLGE